MTEETIRKKKAAKLRGLLATMDVPPYRTQQAGEANLRWLAGNMAINNADHPNLTEALEVIKDILK